MQNSSNKINVGLVQINNSFSGQNYFPYSVGILQAFAEKNLDNIDDYHFLNPVYSRIPVLEAVERLSQADIVAFSTYVWNARITLKIAETLKSRNPDVFIIFGGPHVPDRSEGFLRKNPFIDLACHGEGEQVFLSVLRNFRSGDWRSAPSISYLNKDGSFAQNPKGPRLMDLSVVPSPYLEGVFDRLMEANPAENWIALWETNRGCPFSCTFCDWGSAVASKVYSWEIERLYREVDWFAAHKIEYVFCADANFGILPRDVDVVRYCAQIKDKFGYPQALSVQNTKNATERSYLVQKILSDAGLNKGVVVSLQSVDTDTLVAIKRSNIKLETYHEVQKRFAAEGVETMTDLILALPGETYDSFSRGVSAIIENGQHNRIQFNNLSILPNAEMGDPEYQKKYGMVTVETKVINFHGELNDSGDEPFETQDLVIATDSMPEADWVKTRAFCWMAGFLHFDKILQIPLVVLHETTRTSYEELIKLFAEGRFNHLGSSEDFPILTEICDFFTSKATDIQNGGSEYCHSKEWLNIWWPADEFVLIKICVENKLDAFYDEAQRVIALLCDSKSVDLPFDVIREAILLNKSLIKLPFQTSDLHLELSYNVWDFYRSAVTGKRVPLEPRATQFHIDRTKETWDNWEDWFRKVIWWGNKKGAYLYGSKAVDAERAGHY